jgi:phosphatidylglycerophosphatase A
MEIINENNNNNNCMKSCIGISFKWICGKLTFIVIILSSLLVFAILQLINDGYSESKYIAKLLASDIAFKVEENHDKALIYSEEIYGVVVLFVLIPYFIFWMVYPNCIFKQYEFPSKLLPRRMKPRWFRFFFL